MLGCPFPTKCSHWPSESRRLEDVTTLRHWAGDGARCVLCMAHDNAEVSEHDRLKLPLEAVARIAAPSTCDGTDNYAVAIARVERLAATSQQCIDQACLGYSHTACTVRQDVIRRMYGESPRPSLITAPHRCRVPRNL